MYLRICLYVRISKNRSVSCVYVLCLCVFYVLGGLPASAMGKKCKFEQLFSAV